MFEPKDLKPQANNIENVPNHSAIQLLEVGSTISLRNEIVMHPKVDLCVGYKVGISRFGGRFLYVTELKLEYVDKSAPGMGVDILEFIAKWLSKDKKEISIRVGNIFVFDGATNRIEVVDLSTLDDLLSLLHEVVHWRQKYQDVLLKKSFSYEKNGVTQSTNVFTLVHVLQKFGICPEEISEYSEIYSSLVSKNHDERFKGEKRFAEIVDTITFKYWDILSTDSKLVKFPYEEEAWVVANRMLGDLFSGLEESDLRKLKIKVLRDAVRHLRTYRGVSNQTGNAKAIFSKLAREVPKSRAQYTDWLIDITDKLE